MIHRCDGYDNRVGKWLTRLIGLETHINLCTLVQSRECCHREFFSGFPSGYLLFHARPRAYTGGSRKLCWILRWTRPISPNISRSLDSIVYFPSEIMVIWFNPLITGVCFLISPISPEFKEGIPTINPHHASYPHAVVIGCVKRPSLSSSLPFASPIPCGYPLYPGWPIMAPILLVDRTKGIAKIIGDQHFGESQHNILIGIIIDWYEGSVLSRSDHYPLSLPLISGFISPVSS